MKTIVTIFHKRLIGFIRLYTRKRELAEEVAQEVFLAAYLQRDSVRCAEGLRPWLFTVAKRKALRAAEKVSRASEVGEEDLGLAEALFPVQAEQGESLLLSQLGTHLREAFRQIPSRDREILILRYFGNLQVKEISEVLGIPMGSVGVFLNRTLARLRKILENQGIEPEDVLSR
jgi:RNA polymerase sigma-70 factor (ECF subfamily)